MATQGRPAAWVATPQTRYREILTAQTDPSGDPGELLQKRNTLPETPDLLRGLEEDSKFFRNYCRSALRD